MHSIPRTLPFGSIVSGTCRPEDIIPALLDAADPRSLRMSKADRAAWRQLSREWDAIAAVIADAGDDTDARSGRDLREDRDGLVESLYALLESYCPSYAYLGAHPGDGADTGVWLSESFDYDFDGLKVDDTGDVPTGYSGEVLQVSDHGNPTLFVYSRGRSRVVWSLV